MIFYTEETSELLDINKAVERNQSGHLVIQSNSEAVGVVMSSNVIADTNPSRFESRIYVGGGGGQSLILGADWDGVLTRFEFQNGLAIPISSGGDGWLIPEFPSTTKNSGDIVQGAIYK